MMGRWTAAEEIDAGLEVKIGTLITTIGTPVLQARKTTRRQMREQLSALLKTGHFS